jgi:hypothetical protein
MSVGYSVSGMGIGCSVPRGSHHELQTSDITFDKHSALMASSRKKRKKKRISKC